MKKSPDLSEKIIGFLPENACIVDVGCGDAEFLRSLIGKGYRLIGVDPVVSSFSSSDSTIVTSTIGVTQPENDLPIELTLLKGKAEALPLPDSCADVVLMQCVFSLCDEAAAIREIKRVLKPDGLLIITDLVSGLGSVELEMECCGATNTAGISDDVISDDVFSDDVSADSLPRLRKLLTKEDMEKCFEKHFTLLSYSDEKHALIQMMIEAIFNDDCLCISSEEQALLKSYKAGYGMWVWKSRTEE